MDYGQGIFIGHWVTLRRFALTFWHDIRNGVGLHRRGGGHQIFDFFRKHDRGKEPTVQQNFEDRWALHGRVSRRAAARLRAFPRLAGAGLRRR